MGRGTGVRWVGPEAVQIDFRWKGERCRERLRLRKTAANDRFARNLKARVEHEIATGTFDYARHFPESGRARLHGTVYRLATALSDYCDGLANTVEPETLREYRQCADSLVEGVGNKDLHNLTRADIRNWIAKSPLSKKRLDNLLIPLRGALAQAVDDGILTKNPLAGFKYKRVGSPKKDIDPFTPEEVERLAGVVSGNLWAFWAWTGLRSGEIIGLQWGDVDDGRERITVRRAVRLGRSKEPKTEAGRRVLDLLGPASECLSRIRKGAESPWVFTNPNTGRGWHEAKALNRAFQRACKEAGVRYRYVYQLRHSFASRALSSGENPLWVARYMGHTDIGMVQRHYGKWIPSADPLAGTRMVGSQPSKAARPDRGSRNTTPVVASPFGRRSA
jgi:integrase